MLASMLLNKKKAAFGNTVMLLHFDGTNGGTSFTDDASPSRVLTPSAAVTSSTQTLFGGTSLYTNGQSGSRLYTASAPELKLTTEWTIEFFVYLVSIASNTWLFGKNTIGSASCLKTYNGTLYLEPDDGTQITCPTSAMKSGQWQHYAIVNHSGWYYLYLGGVLQASKAVTGAATMGNNTAALSIGGSSFDTSTSNAYFQEFRISKIPRYLSNFTPPTARFTLD